MGIAPSPIYERFVLGVEFLAILIRLPPSLRVNTNRFHFRHLCDEEFRSNLPDVVRCLCSVSATTRLSYLMQLDPGDDFA